jgi:hypothetical protein
MSSDCCEAAYAAGWAASAALRPTWGEVVGGNLAAWIAGYDKGVADGWAGRLKDEHQAAVHELACQTIGLAPYKGHPLWSIAS